VNTADVPGDSQRGDGVSEDRYESQRDVSLGLEEINTGNNGGVWWRLW